MSDWFVIPFSILWLGFAAMWTITAILGGAPLFFQLVGILFVVFGIRSLFWRFISDMHVRSTTNYVVTDQRILILSGRKNHTLESLDLEKTSVTNFTEHSNDRGTITFSPPSSSNPGVRIIIGRSRQKSPAFIKIENASRVLKQIQDAQARLPS